MRGHLDKLNIFLLCLVILILPFSNIKAQAKTVYPCYGEILQSKGKGYTKIYSNAGTEGHEPEGSYPSVPLYTIYDGSAVKVLGEVLDGDEDIWYKVKYGENYSFDGFVYSEHVILRGEYIPDPEFEDWLNKQGFPDSYKDNLRNLHALYPDWVFYADHTDIEWSAAVAEFSKVGAKLVSGSRPDAWKSLEKDAYNWQTNTWIQYDSGGWVTATKQVVEYYIDPRNFLTNKDVYMFLTQSYDSVRDTDENLAKIISGTFLDAQLPDDTSKSYTSVIKAASEDKDSRVSPIVLSAIILLEQGSDGRGGSISGTIEGYYNIYNFFNIGSYMTNNMNAVQRGLWWASGEGAGKTTYDRPWNTREKAILGGAKWYGGSYVSKGQDTLYYKDFNVKKGAASAPFTHQYATNIEDAYLQGAKMAKAFSGIDTAMTFHIPVYKNMPESTSLPAAGLSGNNLLSSLSIEGYQMEFDPQNYDYELIVADNKSSITVSAQALDSKSTITGLGAHNLSAGLNDINITVTAENGEQRVYNIGVYRNGSGDPSGVAPEITGNYNVGEFVTGVSPETSVADFITKLGVKNGTVKILSKTGDEKKSGNIATGDSVLVYDNNYQLTRTVLVVIYGDTNGDGIINSRDLLLGQRYILNIVNLNKYQIEAIEVTHDGSINSRDLLATQRHILNLSTIIQ